MQKLESFVLLNLVVCNKYRILESSISHEKLTENLWSMGQWRHTRRTTSQVNNSKFDVQAPGWKLLEKSDYWIPENTERLFHKSNEQNEPVSFENKFSSFLYIESYCWNKDQANRTFDRLQIPYPKQLHATRLVCNSVALSKNPRSIWTRLCNWSNELHKNTMAAKYVNN